MSKFKETYGPMPWKVVSALLPKARSVLTDFFKEHATSIKEMEIAQQDGDAFWNYLFEIGGLRFGASSAMFLTPETLEDDKSREYERGCNLYWAEPKWTDKQRFDWIKKYTCVRCAIVLSDMSYEEEKQSKTETSNDIVYQAIVFAGRAAREEAISAASEMDVDVVETKIGESLAEKMVQRALQKMQQERKASQFRPMNDRQKYSIGPEFLN